MEFSATRHGQLVVWTDIDPHHEDDFNQWYDREHMEERVRIPGMPWARRYRACGPGRQWLAIYRTETLATFVSDAYRAAFTNQTDWSNRNFARMANTQRRVMAVTHEAGFGAGRALIMAELVEGADPVAIARMLAPVTDLAGVLRIQIMAPDADLSTPLPSEAPGPRILRPMVLVDVTADPAGLARTLAGLLGPVCHATQEFDLIWSLDAADIATTDADRSA